MTRPWGFFIKLVDLYFFWVKVIYVKPGKRLSLQSHKNRNEVWFCLRGVGMAEVNQKEKLLLPRECVKIPRGVVHRLKGMNTGLWILEIAYGRPQEKDIKRYEDDYNRA